MIDNTILRQSMTSQSLTSQTAVIALALVDDARVGRVALAGAEVECERPEDPVAPVEAPRSAAGRPPTQQRTATAVDAGARVEAQTGRLRLGH